MDKIELENRTKEFAIRVVRFVADLGKDRIADVLGRQLLRSGTSIGANYREANRSVSRSDFIYRIAIVEKEASETHYWLELMQAAALGNPGELQWLLSESQELIAIFTAIGKSTKRNSRLK